MGTEAPVPKPILDQYGIFASHRKEEQDGTVWSQEPPTGVQIAIEQAKKSDIFFTAERPWEEDANLRIVTMLHEGGRYRMWYSSALDITPQGRFAPHGSAIVYAESRDGPNWIRDDAITLLSGNKGAEDAYACFAPCVVRRGNVLWMYYSMGSADQRYQTGLATCP